MLVINRNRNRDVGEVVPPTLVEAVKRALAPPDGNLLAVQADLSDDAGRDAVRG